MHPLFAALHLITDGRPGRDPIEVVTCALRAKKPLVVQVRVDDDVSDRDAYELATRIQALCWSAGVVCLVNDRVDVALAVGADGVHVGADDLPVAVARRLLGERAIVGATVRDPAGALRAVADGASYLGVGPAFATQTKPGLPQPIGLAGVAAVAVAVEVPVIAIGGVTVERAAQLRSCGAYGVAVVDAISGAADPEAAVHAFMDALGSA